jgi:centromeric protein E
VKDLLDSENTIDIIEKDKMVVPKSVQDIEVYKPEDIKAAALRLQRERRLGETRMNKSSSRSHTILRVKITSLMEPDATGNEATCVGMLNFVDLAGSEKASQTGVSGERLKEAQHINTSLSALSKVVMQLSQQWDRTKLKEKVESSSLASSMCSSVGSSKQPKSRIFTHVSYRDSKLTRLLQSSLGGDALVAIICNVTPAAIEETISTLR